MNNNIKYNIKNVAEILHKDGLTLLETNYKNAKQKLLCKDSKGYFIYIILSNYLCRRSLGNRFDVSNDFTIQNINHFLAYENVPFICISNQYKGNEKELDFLCLRCGKIVKTSWRNVNKNDNKNRHRVLCPNCDGRIESLHAIILKQMFLHYYPDTVVEDRTYISEDTGFVRPTDIVNHRLKIAVEVQSQWHDFIDIRIKDEKKKNFWLSKGYSFYAPDIRNYSVLEMCQIFFKIDEIPDWVNYNYRGKLNLKEIQIMLNEGKIVTEIARIMNVHPHRIYDALQCKKLFYPPNYKYNYAVKKNHILQKSSETAG